MNKRILSYEKVFQRCDEMVKSIKTTIDKCNGYEKHLYKISGYSKNDLILASIFMSKCKYSYFDFEIEYLPENADVIIKDIIYHDEDKLIDKLCFGFINYDINPDELKKGIPVFPWEA